MAAGTIFDCASTTTRAAGLPKDRPPPHWLAVAGDDVVLTIEGNIARVAPDGKKRWVRQLVMPKQASISISALANDAAGDVYFVGEISGPYELGKFHVEPASDAKYKFAKLMVTTRIVAKLDGSQASRSG